MARSDFNAPRHLVDEHVWNDIVVKRQRLEQLFNLSSRRVATGIVHSRCRIVNLPGQSRRAVTVSQLDDGTRRAGAIIRRVSRHCEGPLRAQEATKIAIAPGINRNRRVERLQDVAASRSLEREEEEAFVVAIVKLRDHDRPADRAAWIMAHTGGALSGERITGVKEGCGVVVEQTAVQLIG